MLQRPTEPTTHFVQQQNPLLVMGNGKASIRKLKTAIRLLFTAGVCPFVPFRAYAR